MLVLFQHFKGQKAGTDLVGDGLVLLDLPADDLQGRLNFGSVVDMDMAGDRIIPFIDTDHSFKQFLKALPARTHCRHKGNPQQLAKVLMAQ